MNQPFENWKQIHPDNNEDIQKIILLLVEFVERTGQHKNYHDIDAHYARFGVALANPQNIKVYIKHLGGYVYVIIGEVKSNSTRITTAWVHEDGIQQERIEHKDIEHPVHTIVCVTDLYQKCISPEVISDSVYSLMEDRTPNQPVSGVA